MNRLTKTERLLNAMSGGKRITVWGALTKIGFASPNSVTATISRLRREGFNITSTVARGGRFSYTLAN